MLLRDLHTIKNGISGKHRLVCAGKGIEPVKPSTYALSSRQRQNENGYAANVSDQ